MLQYISIVLLKEAMIFDAWGLDTHLACVSIVALTSLRNQETREQKCKLKLVIYYFLLKILE